METAVVPFFIWSLMMRAEAGWPQRAVAVPPEDALAPTFCTYDFVETRERFFFRNAGQSPDGNHQIMMNDDIYWYIYILYVLYVIVTYAICYIIFCCVLFSSLMLCSVVLCCGMVGCGVGRNGMVWYGMIMITLYMYVYAWLRMIMYDYVKSIMCKCVCV
jgi:hypothetical protein